MEEERKNAKQKMQELMNQYYEISSVASMTECTGMIPAPPMAEDELNSYAEINQMAKPSAIAKTQQKKNRE